MRSLRSASGVRDCGRRDGARLRGAVRALWSTTRSTSSSPTWCCRSASRARARWPIWCCAATAGSRPHTWTNGIGLLANLHVCAASAAARSSSSLRPAGLDAERRDFMLAAPVRVDRRRLRGGPPSPWPRGSCWTRTRCPGTGWTQDERGSLRRARAGWARICAATCVRPDHEVTAFDLVRRRVVCAPVGTGRAWLRRWPSAWPGRRCCSPACPGPAQVEAVLGEALRLLGPARWRSEMSTSSLEVGRRVATMAAIAGDRIRRCPGGRADDRRRCGHAGHLRRADRTGVRARSAGAGDDRRSGPHLPRRTEREPAIRSSSCST